MTVRDFRSLVEEVTDAEKQPLGSSSRMMRFLDSCSCVRATFSVPRTMKYPPGSSGHSPAFSSSSCVRSRSQHLAERSIMGMLPIRTLRAVTAVVPREYFTSTKMGDA
jgi:hypothetical protein